MKKYKSNIKDENRWVENGNGITVLKPAKPASTTKKTVKKPRKK